MHLDNKVRSNPVPVSSYNNWRRRWDPRRVSRMATTTSPNGSMATTVGKLPEFHPDDGNFEVYLERF